MRCTPRRQSGLRPAASFGPIRCNATPDHPLRECAMQDRVPGSGAGRARIWVAVVKFSTQQIHIDAPVERVWDLVGDPNRHPDWWPEMVEVDCADLHEGCRYRGVVKGVVGSDEHELLVERLELENLDGCREVAIFCEGTGVTTTFMLTEAQGGTFVEGRFSVDPASLGMRVLSAVAGRRFLRSWLDRSLHNLKTAAERTASPAA